MSTRSRRTSAVADEGDIRFLEDVEIETTCSLCYAEFLDEEDLKIHQKQVHLNFTSKGAACKVCTAIFPCASDLVMHFIHDHVPNLHFCFYCHRAFTKQVLLEQHEIRHCIMRDTLSINCSQCPSVLISRPKLRTHEFNYHKDSEDGVILNNLFSLLSSALNMQITNFIDSICKNKYLTCVSCNYETKRVNVYIDHLIRSNCRSYTCDKCYKVFYKRLAIVKHMKRTPKCLHIVEAEIHRQCLKCDKSFDNTEIKIHEKSCKVMKCSLCNAIFSSIDDLTNHRAQNHSAVLQVSVQICKFCKKEFVGAENLKKHVQRAHKNMRQYKYPCMHCDNIFTHPSKLFGHFYTKHKTIDPYMCKICDKKFRLRRKFTIHIKLEHKSVGFVEFDQNLHVIFTDKKSENAYRPETPEWQPDESTEHASDDDNTDVSLKSNENTKSEGRPLSAEVNEDSAESNLGQSVSDSVDMSSQNSDDVNVVKACTKSNETSNTDETTDADTQNSDEISIMQVKQKLNEAKDIEDTMTTDVNTQRSDDTNLRKDDSKLKDSNDEVIANIKILSSDELSLLKNSNDNRKTNATRKQKAKSADTNVKYGKKLLRRGKRKAKVIPLKPAKRAAKNTSDDPEDISITFSDEEPLSNVRETILKRKDRPWINFKERTKLKNKTIKLTCNICNKYCYTYQNYHHHMSLHGKNKLKRCIKCLEHFKSKTELNEHISSAHSSSKLTETLRKLLEKRKTNAPSTKPMSRPAETLKSVLEERKKNLLMSFQNTTTNKFRKTIKKVDVTDDCSATITPMSDHGMSLRSFVEHFKADDSVNISNSVTIKPVTEPTTKEPFIKMRKFKDEIPVPTGKLRFPVKFTDNTSGDGKVSVRLVQQLITKPRLINFSFNEKVPTVTPPPEEVEPPNEYCNTFADETDYTQYKHETTIPEVGHEVMLGSADDIPRTKRLAQEIIIPNIPEKYGSVMIGHLHPDAPFYKIVEVKKLINGSKDQNEPDGDAVPESNLKLPDGTQLVTVKNPFSHLIPNSHLQEILKANKNKYYTPKVKNIERALAKALSNLKPPPAKKRSRRRKI